ncbi:MAG: hypothetical protein ABJE66_15440 [Deltaproteobacteria bacterium]
MKSIRCLALSCMATTTAAAAPGLTLDPGQLFVQLDLELNASSGAVGKPFSIAPDVSVGATHDLTVSLIHSTYGTTGFRGGTGLGLCVTGTSGGCAHPYNNVGGEAVYSVVKGDAAMALVGGLYSLDLADGWVDLKLGLKTKLSSGPLALTVNPSVYAALDHRDSAVANADQLYVPIGLSYKFSPVVTAGVGSGIKGPVKQFTRFGDSFIVPLGVNAVVTLDPEFAVGGSFTFGKLVGGTALADAATGTDYRGIHVWINYTH